MAVVGLGLVYLLISRIGIVILGSSDKSFNTSGLLAEIIDYARSFVSAFLVIWLMPTAVKAFYKIKKAKYDYFTNYFRIQAALTALGKALLIILALVFIIISVLKNSLSSSLVYLPLILIGFLVIIAGIGIVIAAIVLNVMLLNRTFGLTYGKSIFVWIVTAAVIGILIMFLVIFIGSALGAGGEISLKQVILGM